MTRIVFFPSQYPDNWKSDEPFIESFPCTIHTSSITTKGNISGTTLEIKKYILSVYQDFFFFFFRCSVWLDLQKSTLPRLDLSRQRQLKPLCDNNKMNWMNCSVGKRKSVVNTNMQMQGATEAKERKICVGKKKKSRSEIRIFTLYAYKLCTIPI